MKKEKVSKRKKRRRLPCQQNKKAKEASMLPIKGPCSVVWSERLDHVIYLDPPTSADV